MSKETIGLGIETSCDETAIAVVRNGVEILSNVIYSQIAEHAPFRGVVPEIASRAHLEKINHVFAEALTRAGVSAERLDYVAVSIYPGLTGSLMIGAQFAKSLALVHDLPVIGVDHVEAHLYAVRLEGHAPTEPYLGLLLSGGNSCLFRVRGPGQLDVLADTLDDACGEAFDKTAAILELGYPGGPEIERTARGYTERPGESLFPQLLKNSRREELCFSFSGIKTAVLRAHQQGHDPRRICFDFQERVFELVERVLVQAVQRSGIWSVVASGGVLANGMLRQRLRAVARREGWDLVYPEERLLCTDNGAMVAALGYSLWKAGGWEKELDFTVASSRVIPTA